MGPTTDRYVTPPVTGSHYEVSQLKIIRCSLQVIQSLNAVRLSPKPAG